MKKYIELQSNESGSLVSYVAIVLPVFMLCLLLTIDASSALAAKGKVVYTQDAVGIAAASVSENFLKANSINIEDYALRFSQLNLGKDYKVNMSESEGVFSVSGEVLGNKKTVFGAATGNADIELGTGKASKVISNSSASAKTAPTLLALVLDGSGSMRGSKTESLKVAVQDLVKQTLETNSGGDLWISQTVYSNQAEPSRNYSNNYLTVLDWNGDIYPTGGTNGKAGMQAAQARTNEHIAFDSRFASYEKKVIIMTDGITSDKPGFNEQCTIMKNEGYEIYGIAFGSDADTETIKKCASPGKSYQADSTEALIDTFRAITTRIIQTRIEG